MAGKELSRCTFAKDVVADAMPENCMPVFVMIVWKLIGNAKNGKSRKGRCERCASWNSRAVS
jgi:hypothetical protein